jgi:hypothetical protein
MKRNPKLATRKKEVTLMTLLANEATSDSRKLLNEYKQADATSEADLEQKLANLYFATDDKIQLEKKLANIHPHKNWLVRTLDLTEKEQPKLGTGSMIIDEQLEKSNQVLPTVKSSGFVGDNLSPQTQPKSVENNSNSNSLIQTATVLGIFSIIGLTFIVVSKNLNK